MLYTFFRLFSICFTGASTAFLLVAKYVYAPLVRIAAHDKDEPPPFEWRYLEELEALPERDLSADELVELGEREVDAETPDGRVIMTYDDDAQSFAYYTDSKTISFKYLDAMARQFAVENDAKQICVNYGYDYVASEAKPAEVNERQSVFVKLKPRPSKPKRTKITNRFSHRGSIEQKWTVLEKPPPSLTFADYKKKCVDNA